MTQVQRCAGDPAAGQISVSGACVGVSCGSGRVDPGAAAAADLPLQPLGSGLGGGDGLVSSRPATAAAGCGGWPRSCRARSPTETEPRQLTTQQ